MPRAEDAPRIAVRLLTTTIPFAILLPSDLAPRIADAHQFDDQPDLQSIYSRDQEKCKKQLHERYQEGQ